MASGRWRNLLKVPKQTRQPGAKRRGIYLLPNLLTTGALFAGFYTIVASINGDFEAAALAVLAAMVLDFADGRIARYTHTESDFGAEYDSLSDMVSFGVAPGLLAFMYGLSNLGQVGWVVTFVYVACVALRLARFNLGAALEYFTGLASPAAAGLVACSVWFFVEWSGDGPTDSFSIGVILSLVILVAGILMVSNIAYVSPKAVRLSSRVPFPVLVGVALVFALVLWSPHATLLAMFAIYAASGPVQWFGKGSRSKKTPSSKKQKEENDADQEARADTPK